MSICSTVCTVPKAKVSAHLSIFAIPGVDVVNLGHGPPSKCSSWASAHWKLPKEKQWALLFLIYILTIRDSKRFTWGTRECPSRWRSPWVKHTSSCGCWWLPWRGSQTHRCPKRLPAPAEHRPQSTASWQRGKEVLQVQLIKSIWRVNPGHSSLPPHLLLVFVSHIHHHLQVSVSTCCACNIQRRMLFYQLVS